jgi:hypothetical protein
MPAAHIAHGATATFRSLNRVYPPSVARIANHVDMKAFPLNE